MSQTSGPWRRAAAAIPSRSCRRRRAAIL